MQNYSDTVFSGTKRPFFEGIFTIRPSEFRQETPFCTGNTGLRAIFMGYCTGLHFGAKNRISLWKFQSKTNRRRDKKLTRKVLLEETPTKADELFHDPRFQSLFAA